MQNTQETGRCDTQLGSQVPWLILTVILSGIGLAAAALIAWLQFGSIWSAVGFLRGERLIPDAYSKNIGTALAGQIRTVEFRLTNYLDHSIKIVGFTSSCTCTYASELPITIPSSGTKPLKVNVRLKSNQVLLSEHIRIYTDDPHLKDPVLHLTGRLSQ